MSNDVNNLNVRFLVDVPPATDFVCHSSELKEVYVNKLRMDFLNYKGQDFFAKNCNPAEEENWNSVWKDQAEIRYNQEGDYKVNIATGEEMFIDLNIAEPIKVCSEYIWYKQALNSELLVSIVYMDCDCTVQTVKEKVKNLIEPFILCAYDLPSVTNGIIAYSKPCPTKI
jgi:hypothetical protein